MFSYIFILGHNPKLSTAEITAILDTPPTVAKKDFAIYQSEQKIGQIFLDKLGGSLKIFELIEEIGKQKIWDKCSEILEPEYADKKLTYGISVYGGYHNELKSILIGTKKNLQKSKMSSRFTNKDFKNLSPAQTINLNPKIEIAVCKTENETFIGKLVAVQDIESYTKRDYGRPARSAKKGMFPPKLAQILLNLAGAKEGMKVYDPFCGSGTVLTEAMLMGLDVLGSDIDPDQVSDSQKNIEWITKEYKLNQKSEIFPHDATKMFPSKKFDIVVGEGYLGAPLSAPLPEKNTQQHSRIITDIYRGFFREIAKNMQTNQKMVITIPFIMTEKGNLFISRDLKEDINKNFTEVITPYLYRREKQIVGREIFILKKV